jgi:hypothetical protein
MKNSKFRVVPLSSEIAEAARRTGAAGAADHTIMVADSPNSYPCRHCLRWAESGERVVLFPFTSVSSGSPYAESGPVFVHAEPCEQYADTDTYPAQFRHGRALRAYDARRMMIDAIVVNGDGPEAGIEKLLENPETDFIHVRSVTRGCYTMGIARA